MKRSGKWLYKMLFGLTLGILVCQYLPDLFLPIPVSWLFLVLFFLTLLLLFIRKRFLGSLVIMVSAILGVGLHHHYTEPESDGFYQYAESGDNLILEIVESPVDKPKSVSVRARVLAFVHLGSLEKVEGKIQLYVAKSERAASMKVGEVFRANVRWDSIVNDANGLFDKEAFYGRLGIFHTAYLRDSDWETLTHYDARPKPFFENLRDQAEGVIRSWGMREHSRQVMEALVLGDKRELDPELRTKYAEAGVVHVLAVSGLHVGVLYLLFSLIFKFTLGPRGLAFQAVCIILGLWFYAFLTGLSPSVWRAATMFTLLTIGQHLGRITGIYQTIAASAFLLLLLDTQLLFSPGFQLSYAAVLGIVRYQPQFEMLWSPRQKWLRGIWQLISVSLAAQLVTMPISTVYFSQFPTYFLLANLLIIPLLSTLMIFSIGVLMLGLFLHPPTWLIWVLDSFYQLENSIVLFITDLPNAVIRSIHLSLLSAILMSVFIVLLMEAFRARKGRTLNYALLFGVCFFISTIPTFQLGWDEHHHEDIYGKAERYRYKHHSLVLMQSDETFSVPSRPLIKDELVIYQDRAIAKE
ncbi:MAG: ComEC/Rec2 family competence protein [Cryomorphaceae bacterium]|nr:ComEC/Rec2 family competence protein [Cryomorphaceae bacterium]